MPASKDFLEGFLTGMGVLHRGRIAAPLSDAGYRKAKQVCDAGVKEFGSAWRGLPAAHAGLAFAQSCRNPSFAAFRHALGARDLDYQIFHRFGPLALRKGSDGYNIVKSNPAKVGSVEQFIMQRGLREFSIGDVEASVGGTKGMLNLELGRLVAQGKVRKTSKVAGVQFYMPVPAELQAPKPAYVSPTWGPGAPRTPEQERKVEELARTAAEMSSIPEVQMMRAHANVAKAKEAVNKALANMRAADAKVAAAQAARNRGLLMQAEAQQETASAELARAKRNLVDAQLHLRRVDPEGLEAPEKGPRRNPRKRKKRTTTKRRR